MNAAPHALRGKVALVTGAARGIGRAIAVALAREGAHVIIFDTRPGEDSAAAIASDGGTGRWAVGDVASEAEVLRLMDTIRSREGRLDISVNCAGIQLIRPLLETTVEEFERVMSVNVRGTFLVGREAIRIMVGQPEGGRVINIASELAYLGRARYSAYSASKGAIVSLTRSWAREFAPRVLVNAVAPGPTATAMVSLDCMSPEEMRAEVEGLPLGRIAAPEEVAAAAAFLAGPGATYFTGQCISPNGGAVMF